MKYRHGDVGLIRVEALPEGAKRQKRQGDLVLAVGEATGHTHKIREKSASIFVAGDRRYMVIQKPTDLIQTDRTGRIGVKGDGYDLHGAVTVAPGIYEIRIERDYAKGAVPRQVID